MSIYEYDQEGHMQVVREEGWEDGYAQGQNEGLSRGRMEGMKEGIEQGLTAGQDRMLLLIQHMKEHDEMHLMDRLQDKAFLQEMYEKYGI